MQSSALPESATIDKAATLAGPAVAAPGRPREIEAFTNLVLVHPMARSVVDRLVATPITPNQVSVASVFFAASAAGCFLTMAWPWAAFAGLACQIAWHVLDGADGDLARRTGRASPIGELVDGICDHASQVLIYVALALVLQRTIGPWAWVFAVGAGASHFVQANLYETGRKTYRRWVYGASWMRQTAEGASADKPIARLLGRFYLAVSSLGDPGAAKIEAAMSASGPSAEASALYRDLYAPLVKKSGILDSNTRTIAVFVSMLAGNPLWFFVFELVVLNMALFVLTGLRRRVDARLLAALNS